MGILACLDKIVCLPAEGIPVTSLEVLGQTLARLRGYLWQGYGDTYFTPFP